MVGRAFGLDFGTTNSLITVIVGDRTIPLTDLNTNRPHPSVVWYRGGEVVVGAAARAHLDRIEGGSATGFLRSPKMSLRRDGPIIVDGRTIDPVDAVAVVLTHIRRDAAQSRSGAEPYNVERAVFTIPVDFGGIQRRALRNAARKAGIGVVQYVHEPAAALYGYLRSRTSLRRDLAELENRLMLVFDWGGGTLDLTLCRLMGGTLMQVSSAGNHDIGGDAFDERLRNLARMRHAQKYSIEDLTALEVPGMGAKLLTQCESAKIRLSEENTSRQTVLVRDYLKVEGDARNLAVAIDRADIEREGEPLVRRGLAMIDKILDDNRLTYSDIAFCLPTGGMVNMPAIRRGLVERFGGRVPRLDNGDRVISEGAAWIAHDGLRLTLAKPIEVRVADGSGSGHYLQLVGKGVELPVENQTHALANNQFVCADPRNGVAVFEFAKPKGVGLVAPEDDRDTLGEVNLEVDPNARPLLERLSCKIVIDHDYIANVQVKAGNRGSEGATEFHRLEFGLALGRATESGPADDGNPDSGKSSSSSKPSSAKVVSQAGSVAFRPNIAAVTSPTLERSTVAGDLAHAIWPDMFNKDRPEATVHQMAEYDYYNVCGYCSRTAFQIESFGPIAECKQHGCDRKGWIRPVKAPKTSSSETADHQETP